MTDPFDEQGSSQALLASILDERYGRERSEAIRIRILVTTLGAPEDGWIDALVDTLAAELGEAEAVAVIRTLLDASNVETSSSESIAENEFGQG